MKRNELKLSRTQKWKIYLLPEETLDFPISCLLDMPNQRVIKTDSERTRNKQLTKNRKAYLKCINSFLINTGCDLRGFYTNICRHFLA